jgi:hypothetical protein
MTLEESVAAAVKENPPETTVETKTQQTETPKTETPKAEEPKQPTAEEIARNEKLDKAIRLYEALEDPTIGPGVLRSLAEKAGILGVKEGKTETQITKTVVDVLKESLGAEYEFLAPGLAKGISEIVRQTVAEQIRPVQEQTNEAIERAVKADVDSAYAKMESTHKDFKKYDAEMTALSKRLPYTGDYPMEEYLENLYTLVTKDVKETKIVGDTVDKINKNAKELRDSSTEVQDTRVSKGSKLPSIDESVRAAFRGERLA